MKRKFVIFIFLSLCFLCAAYTNSYYALELAKEQNKTLEFEKELAMTPVNGGNPQHFYSYYLMEKQGYVFVYYDDKTTLYEQTSIRLLDLPQNLQEEIKNGKQISDEKELYDFLENYSS